MNTTLAAWTHPNLQLASVRWMIPTMWIQKIILAEVADNNPMPGLVTSLINELKAYRSSFRRLFCYDWVSV
jgi:hypothetical protein